jgi:glycosyltransferase involved in cell wall biosynthesis
MKIVLETSGFEVICWHGFTYKISLIDTFFQKFYPKFTGKFLKINRHRSTIKQYEEQINNRLETLNNDEPVLIFSNTTELIAAIPKSINSMLWTDASFAGMINYYKDFSNIHKSSIVEGNRTEQKAYSNANSIIFSSDWAAKTAIENYNVNKEKISIIQFGANLPSNLSKKEIINNIEAKDLSILKMLFIGTNWERKGGKKALEIIDYLNSKNILTELIIIGCEPFKEDVPPNIKQIGFLNKSLKEDKNQLDFHLKNSHFLLLPTLADCTPIVFNEANSYGLPVISNRTGGIESVIINGKNGILLSTDSTASDYYSSIIEYYNLDNYQKLSKNAYLRYLEHLNWETSSQHVSKLINNLIS